MINQTTQQVSARKAPSRLYTVVGLLITAALFVSLAMSPVSVFSQLTKEGRPIEQLSTVFYFAAALVLLPRFTTQWPYLMVLVFFGLREMDMDKIPFTEGLFKSRQYIGDTVAAPERILSAIVLIVLLVVVITAVKRGLRAPRERGFDGVTLSVMVALALGTTAKTLDGIGRKLAPYGIEVSETAEAYASLYEEVAEFGMALCLLLACIAFVRDPSSKGDPRQ